VERLEAWIDTAPASTLINQAALFRPTKTARGRGADGFRARALSRRAVQRLVARYVARLRLDPAVTVHFVPSPPR